MFIFVLNVFVKYVLVSFFSGFFDYLVISVRKYIFNNVGFICMVVNIKIYLFSLFIFIVYNFI